MADPKKKAGFLATLISRLIDEQSKASPDDRSPGREREGDRRSFKEVEAGRQDIMRQVDQERALMAAYERDGISALIGGPPGGGGKKSQALPSPTPSRSPGFLGRVMGKKSGAPAKRGELPDYARAFEPLLMARARGNKNYNLQEARATLFELVDVIEKNRDYLPLDPKDILGLAYAESGFNRRAVGDQGLAIGLFQVQPIARAQAAKEFGVSPESFDLEKPSHNFLAFMANMRRGLREAGTRSPRDVYELHNPGGYGPVSGRFAPTGDVGSVVPGLFQGAPRNISLPREFLNQGIE